MGQVEGKVALITGAGHGIGRACALRFAREGAKVFGISRTQPGLDEMCSTVKTAGGCAAAATADLSSAEQTARAYAKAVDTYGRVDILVNVAGVGYSWAEKSPGSMNDVATTPVDKWQEVIGINLGSVFNTCHVVIPQMQKQRGGGHCQRWLHLRHDWRAGRARLHGCEGCGHQPDTVAGYRLHQGRHPV